MKSVLAFCLVAVAVVTVAAELTDDQIAAAIKQLGDDTYKKREQASQTLWEAGKLAEPQLEVASRSKDPEVASRARELLAKIKAGLRPNMSPELLTVFQRYGAADQASRELIVLELVNGGATNYPVLQVLAETETDSDARGQVFLIAWQAAVNTIKIELEKPQLTDAEVAQIITALKLCQTILPQDPGAPLRVIQGLDKAGRKKEADELFATAFRLQEKLTTVDPKSADAHNNVAWLCAVARRKLDEALAHAQKAVDLEPQNPAYRDTLAEVRFQRGERDQAIEIIKKAIELAPEVAYFKQQLKRFEAGDRNTPPPEPNPEDFEQ